MDHHHALRISAIEKYLLNELPQDERASFEEHFFDCSQCRLDLRAGIVFLDQTKKELAGYPPFRPKQETTPEKRSFFSLIWRPSFAVPAFAVLLAVLGYQNAVVFPRLTRQAAQQAPEILPSISLAAGNTRGNDVPSIRANGKAFLLLFDIPGETPGQVPFASYTCTLYSPAGALLWQTAIASEQAKDTVSLRVPDLHAGNGIYHLAIVGNSGQNHVALASYRFRAGQPG